MAARTGTDAKGWPMAEVDGVAYRLTRCCHASLKGSSGSIVCRACYGEVDFEDGAHDDPIAPFTLDEEKT